MVSNEFYLSDLWEQTLQYINDNELIKPDMFNSIVSDSKIYSYNNDRVVIACNLFINKVILDQNKAVFKTALQAITGRELVVLSETTNSLKPKEVREMPERLPFIKTSIDPAYTFDNFVVGRSNIQSQVSSLTVATNPGLIYNPLFIYGNSGLGKTHLLNAVGNKIKEAFPDYKIGIVSGLDFVEGVGESIKQHRIDEFKREFYDLDVLLVDDIQFIAGKEKTHEVFFSVFNELVNKRKQICLTCDRMPKDIKGLEERIISRFNQGLNVNIVAPEYETSINILKKKLSQSSMANQNIDVDVLGYIATNFSTDVRTLEGALNRLLFYSITFAPDQAITLSIAQEAFKDQITEKAGELDISIIKKAVCDYYGISKQQLVSKIRTKNIANPRQIAMYLARKYLDLPYKDIGISFGKRDHSTVINACERVEMNIKKDPMYQKAVMDIESSIKK